MPIRSPFHERTEPLCLSYKWKDWAGYYAVCTYDFCHETEYYAFRHSAGLLDVTPLYKYEIAGPDACRLLCRMMVRDISRLRVGRVAYTCWCDDRGKVVDDGTVSRLGEDYYRLTAADPTMHWLHFLSQGLDVTIEDSSRRIAALALQGPTSRQILASCCDVDMAGLEFFGVRTGKVDDLDVWVSRTGYTGDLGYEIWVDNGDALRLWDSLIRAGRDFGIRPCGLDALDMTRIESGFILLGVDYFSATRVVRDRLRSTPYELGLGWMVHLDREPFLGQSALQREKTEGSKWKLAGLELDWNELEELYESYQLPPGLPAMASREALPVYRGRRQVGQATSHTWSPVLKKSIALASVDASRGSAGERLLIEHTVEFERHRVTAVVRKLPFFNPERKRTP